MLLLDKKYKLDKVDYKARMVNLYDDLKLPFDRSTQNISRLWFGNKEAIHYRIKGFALCFDDYKPKPITEAKTIKLFNEYTNDRGLINHWIQSGTIGNRYNELYKAFQYYRDENLSFPEIADKINTINNTFSMPHKQEKIDKDLEKWRKEFPC
ncbi:hypothetical protein EOM09_02985 [bacterium]|nr:hypothetical protein [bacterium]